jgi:hypothetical protein
MATLEKLQVEYVNMMLHAMNSGGSVTPRAALNVLLDCLRDGTASEQLLSFFTEGKVRIRLSEGLFG